MYKLIGTAFYLMHFITTSSISYQFFKQKIPTSVTTFLLLVTISVSTTSCLQQSTPIQLALDGALQATTLVVQNSIQLHELVGSDDISNYSGVALKDCTELYDESAARLTVLLSKNESYTGNDARTWLSGVLANHRSCLDGLDEKGCVRTENQRVVAQNLTMVLGEALALYGKVMNEGKRVIPRGEKSNPMQNGGLLASWNPRTSRADFVVAKDGSGTHRTVNDSVTALARMAHRRTQRIIIYVKSGMYADKVEIHRDVKNVMLVMQKKKRKECDACW